LFLVLDYLEGVSLSKRLGQRVEVPEALRILREIAEALDALHARGLLHGDIEPANIILDATLGRAVLFDFGLVLHAGRVPTTPGGTPGFSAPEQFSGEVALDPSVGVYALAVLAYVLLTRHRPFEGAPELRLVMQQAGTFAPPSGHASELSESLDRWIAAAMSPDPSMRPASARAFGEGLARTM
jgi:serine/threonine-protein kinase